MVFHRDIALSGFRPLVQFVPDCLRNVYIGHPGVVDFLNTLHETVLLSIVVVPHPWILSFSPHRSPQSDLYIGVLLDQIC